MNIEELKVGDNFTLRNGHMCILLSISEVNNYPSSKWIYYRDILTKETNCLPYYNNGRLFSFCESEFDIIIHIPDPFRKIKETVSSFIQFPNQQTCPNHEH